MQGVEQPAQHGAGLVQLAALRPCPAEQCGPVGVGAADQPVQRGGIVGGDRDQRGPHVVGVGPQRHLPGGGEVVDDPLHALPGRPEPADSAGHGA